MTMFDRFNFGRDFTLVAAGQIVSIFGNQILRYALPLHLLRGTGSSALFGAVLALSFIPMLLLFPVGGILADRLRKGRIMVVLDFCTAALVGLFCLLLGRVDLVPLTAGAMVLLCAIQGAYQPAVQASVPLLVDPDRIVGANAAVNLINSVASMAGPVTGGILMASVGLTPILYVSLGCFLLSAVMELFIRIPFEPKPAEGGLLATGLGDLTVSFRFLVRGRPVLLKASLAFASVSLLLTALSLVGLPVIVTGHLGFEPDRANRLYGYAQGVLAAGAVAGGLAAGALAKRLTPAAGPRLLMGCGLSMLPGGVALHALEDPMAVYAVLVAGCGLLVALSTVFQIGLISAIQRLTPGALIGKVIACVTCICMCTGPVGQLVYGLLFEVVGGAPYLPFYVASAAAVGIGLLTRPIFGELDRLAAEGGAAVPADAKRTA